MILLDHFGVTIPMLVTLKKEMPEIMDLLHFCLQQFNERAVLGLPPLPSDIAAAHRGCDASAMGEDGNPCPLDGGRI